MYDIYCHALYLFPSIIRGWTQLMCIQLKRPCKSHHLYLKMCRYPLHSTFRSFPHDLFYSMYTVKLCNILAMRLKAPSKGQRYFRGTKILVHCGRATEIYLDFYIYSNATLEFKTASEEIHFFSLFSELNLTDKCLDGVLNGNTYESEILQVS